MTELGINGQEFSPIGESRELQGLPFFPTVTLEFITQLRLVGLD